MYVSSLGLKMTIHPARKAQLALLLAKKVTVPTKYSDFADVFSEKPPNVLPERTGANEHVIELKEGKQPPYGPIYSLEPVELKTFKTYIETNLANGFIQVSKSPRVLQFCLSASLVVAFACVSITKDSITSQSRIDIRYR